MWGGKELAMLCMILLILGLPLTGTVIVFETGTTAFGTSFRTTGEELEEFVRLRFLGFSSSSEQLTPERQGQYCYIYIYSNSALHFIPYFSIFVSSNHPWPLCYTQSVNPPSEKLSLNAFFPSLILWWWQDPLIACLYLSNTLIKCFHTFNLYFFSTLQPTSNYKISWECPASNSLTVFIFLQDNAQNYYYIKVPYFYKNTIPCSTQPCVPL